MENQIENEMDTEIDENNESEEAIEASEASEAETPTAEATAPAPRKRGRPLGVKVGPRERVWDCAAIVDDELVHVRLTAPDGATLEERGSFTADQAQAQFKEEYGVEPASIHGPYFDQKGAQVATATKKRETVSIPVENLKLTTQRSNAIFKGWKGMAFGIEGREDAVYFMFHEEISPNPDKKRTPPPARPVLRSSLEFEKS